MADELVRELGLLDGGFRNPRTQRFEAALLVARLGDILYEQAASCVVVRRARELSQGGGFVGAREAQRAVEASARGVRDDGAGRVVITSSPNSAVQVSQVGMIAHARFNNVNLNTGSSRFVVKNTRYSVMGMMVHKVGATTGHTRAAVSVVCGDFNRTSGGLNIRMLCQDRAPYIRGGGDSGSPVFFARGTFGEVDLVGIHWGGDFDGQGNPGIYSPWDGIVTDLGLISFTGP